jgi:hypothetical protein
VKRLLLLALLAAFSLSCGALKDSAPDVDPVAAVLKAQEVCRSYPLWPAELQTPEQDRACKILNRVCIDQSLPPLEAPPPALGNRVVLDAGVDGAGGSDSR